MLAFSAAGDRQTVLEMLEAGVVGYLVKGSTAEAIASSIERAAAGQGSLSVEVTTGVIDELAGELHVRRRVDRRRRLRERRIRRVLERPGVLNVVFQPICDLVDWKPVGAEALARFNGAPKRGPEGWFVEAAEVGLQLELELLAVEAALAKLTRLPDGLFVSVNVSPETLAASAFRDVLAGHDGTRVVVELTEHARIDDYDALTRTLAALRAIGVRLAVDDAGAGFASLRHILRLAPDFIKLDRTLIDGIERDRSRQALAAGLITFAEKIGATIVAEGIERQAEVDALAELGVRSGQGFFLARPAPLPLTVPPRGAAAGPQARAAVAITR
jgi:EAL domain-containing protein (putative c-di-GMP-specific phosphodiesterase class I)